MDTITRSFLADKKRDTLKDANCTNKLPCRKHNFMVGTVNAYQIYMFVAMLNLLMIPAALHIYYYIVQGHSFCL